MGHIRPAGSIFVVFPAHQSGIEDSPEFLPCQNSGEGLSISSLCVLCGLESRNGTGERQSFIFTCVLDARCQLNVQRKDGIMVSQVSITVVSISVTIPKELMIRAAMSS